MNELSKSYKTIAFLNSDKGVQEKSTRDIVSQNE